MMFCKLTPMKVEFWSIVALDTEAAEGWGVDMVPAEKQSSHVK